VVEPFGEIDYDDQNNVVTNGQKDLEDVQNGMKKYTSHKVNTAQLNKVFKHQNETR